jgi:hypothetical protein
MSEDRKGQVTLVPRLGRQLSFRDGLFIELRQKEVKPRKSKGKSPREATPESGADSSHDKPEKSAEDPSKNKGGIYPPYWPINVGAYLVYEPELRNAHRFSSLRALSRELPTLTSKLKPTESKIPVAVKVKSSIQLQVLNDLGSNIGADKHLIILVESTSEREQS